MIKFSCFKQANPSNYPDSTASIEAVVNKIKSGSNGLDQTTIRCRELYASFLETGNKQPYRSFKEVSVPAFTPAGIFKIRNADNLSLHSGLVVVDIDDLTPEQVVDVLSRARKNKHVVLAFISPSGSGVKLLFAVSPLPTTLTHLHAWQACVDLCAKLPEADPSGKDAPRLCFFAHDAEAYYNPEAVPVKWELPEVETETQAEIPTETETQQDDDDEHEPPTESQAYDTLRHLDASDYDRWLQVGMAIKAAGLPMAVWEDWSSTAPNFETGACKPKWDSFDVEGKVKVKTWGSVVRWAREAQKKAKDEKTAVDGKKEKGPQAYDIAESFMRRNHYWFTHEQLHQYNEKTGLYEQCVPKLRKSARLQFGSWVRTSKVNEVENHITDMAYRSETASDGVVFKNGILNLATMEMSKHTPQSYHLTGYPVNYLADEKVDEKPFTDFLYGLTQDMDAVITLLQMIGSCFDDDVFELQTSFMLTGSGSNGKSTLLDIVEEVIGLGNICRTPFAEYGKDRWAKADLVDKAVALDDDIDLNVPLGSAMKSLTTKQMQQAEFKYLNKFDFKMTATIIGAINGQPHTLDTTPAFWRRWTIIDFPMTFAKDAVKRKELMDRFTAPEMLDSIATLALREYAKARKAGNFFTPERSAELVDTFQENANHIITFANDCLEDCPENMVTRRAVREAYERWCKVNGLEKPYGPKRFWSALWSEGVKDGKKQKINGKAERMIADVKLV